jgi:hypothetical protein
MGVVRNPGHPDEVAVLWAEVRRLRVTVRWLVAACLLFAGGWAASRLFENTVLARMRQVESSWEGDTLRISTMAGYVAVTHLVRTSEGTPVAARLPTPEFILDSESVRIPYARLRSMEWRDEGQTRRAAPAANSPIRALYYRPTAGELRPLP